MSFSPISILLLGVDVSFKLEEIRQIRYLARQSLEALSDSIIVISGGTGFIGSWLVSSLGFNDNEYNISVIVQTRSIPKARSQFSFLNSSRLIYEHLLGKSDRRITHLIHSATPSTASTGGLNPEYVKQVCQSETQRLLDLASHQERPVLMHLSSGAVYGKKLKSSLSISESIDVNTKKSNAYADSKMYAEEQITAAHRKGIVLGTNPRLFAFTGPGLALDAHFAIGNFMNQGLRGEVIKFNGNPETVRSYLHPIDMTVWLLAALAKPSLETTHIGSEMGYSMAEIAQLVGTEFGVPVDVTGNSDIPANYYFPETKNTRHRLGVEQTIDLPEAIHRWRKWLEL